MANQTPDDYEAGRLQMEATIVRARSEAEASKIKTQSEIEQVELRQRTVRRLITEKMQRQKNMEDITFKAIPYLKEDANPDDMSDELRCVL